MNTLLLTGKCDCRALIALMTHYRLKVKQNYSWSTITFDDNPRWPILDHGAQSPCRKNHSCGVDYRPTRPRISRTMQRKLQITYMAKPAKPGKIAGSGSTHSSIKRREKITRRKIVTFNG